MNLLLGIDWQTLAICALVAVASCYLVWQLATGDLADGWQEDDRSPRASGD